MTLRKVTAVVAADRTVETRAVVASAGNYQGGQGGAGNKGSAATGAAAGAAATTVKADTAAVVQARRNMALHHRISSGW